MPMNSAVTGFPSNPLIPLYAKKVILQAVNLAPNTVFARGTILGNITNTANDVQTVTVTGGPTGGTFTLTGTNPVSGATVTTAPIAFNATAAAVQAALVASGIFGAGNATAAGAGGGPYTITFVGALAGTPVPPLALGTNALTGGTTPGVTVAHTTTGRSLGTFAAYAAGNTDGSQNPTCILKFPCATDASGQITYGTVAGGGEWGQSSISTPAYFGGYFRTQELVGLDANAVTKLGKLSSGTIASGVLDVN